MPKQLNIFVDNKPGKLKAITEILADKEIDIKAVTIQDREEYGMMKLLVDNPEKAQLLLQDRGYACAMKDILAVEIDDHPGALHALTCAFEKHSINIIDAYSYTIESHKKAIWCSEVHDLPSALKSLQDEGFKILTDEDMAEL